VVAAAFVCATSSLASFGHLAGKPALAWLSLSALFVTGTGKSGLFYESHVAEWAEGARPRADLAAEPQARGMPPPTDPNTAQFINLQLNAHEQGRAAWQGQLWPGRDMQWDVERDASGGQDHGDGEGGGTWQSSLRLRFGALGEVAARVVLSGGQLHIRLDAEDESVKGLLDAQRARLADALDAAGTPLSTLTIHDDGQR